MHIVSFTNVEGIRRGHISIEINMIFYVKDDIYFCDSDFDSVTTFIDHH